jgi:hypothetical protein
MSEPISLLILESQLLYAFLGMVLSKALKGYVGPNALGDHLYGNTSNEIATDDKRK